MFWQFAIYYNVSYHIVDLIADYAYMYIVRLDL